MEAMGSSGERSMGRSGSGSAYDGHVRGSGGDDFFAQMGVGSVAPQVRPQYALRAEPSLAVYSRDCSRRTRLSRCM
jgi:hypothetical protein